MEKKLGIFTVYFSCNFYLLLIGKFLDIQRKRSGAGVIWSTALSFVQIKIIVFYYLKLFIFPFNLSVDSGMSFTSVNEDPFIFMAALIIFGLVAAADRKSVV